MSDRAILTKRVEKLLGFDGADDVLDHLLTIESESVRALRLMLYDYFFRGSSIEFGCVCTYRTYWTTCGSFLGMTEWM
jgi:hypothetical protein